MSNRTKVARPQHHNTFAYKHNPNSKKTEKILSSPNEGVCQNCWDRVEWRKKFRKYKPLTAPARCVGCQQKNVKIAYHIQCVTCAEKNGLCAICKKFPIVKPYVALNKSSKQEEEEAALQRMTERQRRTYLRELAKEQEATDSKQRKKKGLDDSSDLDFSDDDDDLGDMPMPPPRKFDPDMLNRPEDDEDGSAESFEDDSDELDKVDADAQILLTKKAYELEPKEESGESEDEGAGSDAEP